MKYEETNEMLTIRVEPTDEWLAVVRWVRYQDQHAKPIVIVLPEDASRVFRYLEDLRELQAAQEEHDAAILLVIAGGPENERLRQWVQRQGFLVFASTEACTRLLGQRTRNAPQTPFNQNHQRRYQHNHNNGLGPGLGGDIMRPATPTNTPLPQHIAPMFNAKAHTSNPHPSPNTTIGISTNWPGNDEFSSSGRGQARRALSPSPSGPLSGPANIPIMTLEKHIPTPTATSKEVAQRLPIYEPAVETTFYGVSTPARPNAAPFQPPRTPMAPGSSHKQRDTEPLTIKHNNHKRLLIILLILLALGILGGIGFGYLLTLGHGTLDGTTLKILLHRFL